MTVERIIAGIPQRSVAERKQMRENAGAKLLSGTPKEQEEAQALLVALDDAESSERRALAERMQRASPKERVIAAYRVLPPTDTDRRVITALADNPGSTSAALSKACGWAGNAWHLHFGTMCFQREAYLWPAERVEKRDANFYSGILADFDAPSSSFTMKPEVQAAFAEIGLARKT